MLLGPIIGSAIQTSEGYINTFNANAGFLIVLLIIAQIVYPYDSPIDAFV
jgi:hypothetical protein